MKQLYKDLRSTVLVALIAFLVCWASNQWIFYPKYHPADPDQWLEEQLSITPEQMGKLKNSEDRYENERARLLKEIASADRELAQILIQEHGYSEKIEKAAHRVNTLQAELKQLTLKHFYEMKPVLTPEQIEKMNQLIVHALSHSP